MSTFLITCKMEFIRLGITSVLRDLFPDAVLLHADSRQECLRILMSEKTSLMISDGTVDKGPNLSMVRKARALQPDIKIVMLLEDPKINHLRTACVAGEIDTYIGQNAPIKRIHEAILHVLSGAEA